MLVLLLIGVFVAAAAAWPLLQPRRPRVARWLPPAAAMVALGLAGLLAEQDNQTVVLSTWTTGASGGSPLALAADPLALLFVGIIALVIIAASLAGPLGSAGDDLLPVDIALWMAAAAVAFSLAGNTATLTLVWVLMDMTILSALRFLQPAAPRPVRIQALAFNYIGALLVFMAGVTATGFGADLANQVWMVGTMAGLPAALLTVAAWLRLGAYPFQRNIPTGGASRAATLLRFLPLTAGAYLVARAASVAGGAPIEGWGWALVLGLATLAAAGMAWLASSRSEALMWLGVYAASSLLLGLVSGQVEVGALTLFGSVGLILAVTMLFLGEPLLGTAMSAAQRGWTQVALVVGLLSVWGLPLTAGFLYRWGTLRADLEASALLGLVFTVLAAAVAAAPLWLIARDLWGMRRARDAAASPAARDALLGISLLAVALVAIGVVPALIAPAAEVASGPVGLSVIADGVRGTPPNMATLIVGLLLGAWLAGLGLSLVRAQLPPDSRTVRDLGALLSMDWLYRRRWRPVRVGLGLFQTLASLGAGERYVGMLVIFAFILALALLAQS